jgi:hypothetical protein
MNFNLLFGRRVQANASYPDTSFPNSQSSSDPPQDLGNTLLDRKIHQTLPTQYDTAFQYKNHMDRRNQFYTWTNKI